jgi:alcohol sulfotransferase
MDPDDERIRETIEVSSVENMRKLEKENYFRRGSRLKAKDSSNPDSFKVRRAKVGGYRDYFDDEQVATIDEMVNTRLSGVFGYALQESTASGAAAAGKATAEG